MSAGDVDFISLRKDLTTLLQDEHPELRPLVIYLCFMECSTFNVADKVARPSFSDEQLFKKYKDLIGPMCELYTKFSREFPDLSKADFWTLGAIISIKLLGGPDITWRSGRKDGTGTGVPREKRVPAPKEGAAQLHQDFKRLGLSDEEGVALCGAHTVGRCHLRTSGFEGRFTENEKLFDNSYFKDLLEKTWVPETTKEGHVIYKDINNKDIIKMPSDIALLEDESFHGYVEKFAKNEDEWKEKFSKSFEKLIDLGYDDLRQSQF